MKLKKVALIIMITLLALLLSANFNVSNAAIESTPKYLTITPYRSSNGYAYQVLGGTVYKIVETNSTGTTTIYDTIYCLKGGPGFGSDVWGSSQPTVSRYTVNFDMKNPDEIESTYRDTLPADEDTYNELVWVLEHVYVPASSTASDEEKAEALEYKQWLLDEAGLFPSSLTDEDIDLAQQLAIWHFTNSGEYGSYDVGTSFSAYINYTAWGTDYNSLDNLSSDRHREIQELYKYFINGAVEAVKEGYEASSSSSSQPYQFASTNKSVNNYGDGYYKIGPFKIDKISDTDATLTATITSNGQTVTTYSLQNSAGSTYTNIAATIGQEFYVIVPNTISTDLTIEISGSYYDTEITYWSVVNAPANEQPVVIVERGQTDYSDIASFTFSNYDLALRKFITAVNTDSVIDRIPDITTETISNLANGYISTAIKTHKKTAVTVSTGDIVEYTIRIYNEGNVDAIAAEITDYLPAGLRLVEDHETNILYGWRYVNGSYQEEQVNEVITTTLEKTKIDAFNNSQLSYVDVKIVCEVVATVQETDTYLKNIAEITRMTDLEGNEVTDRDSVPDNLTDDQKNNYNPGTSEQGEGYQDDDDYEDLVIFGNYFDLALRKFISQVNDTTYSRAPTVDVSTLKAGEETAIYEHSKNPVAVSAGDKVIYTIRVYNEGQIDGYVDKITDYLPEWLEFIVNDELNAQYGWILSGDGTVTTDITSPNTNNKANQTEIYDERDNGVLLKAYDGGDSLDYIDVKIKCEVKDSVTAGYKLTNIAEISEYSNDESATDRDSIPGNIILPTEESLPYYKDDEIERGDTYIPGQEDDDDFEKVVINVFDLALRKFITGVNEDSVDDRYPVFVNNNGEYSYEHTKDPVLVKNGDTVIYTIRVYNEGQIAGYAEEVKDDIPDGLEFLPNNTTNQNYRWKMYDADGNVTDDVSKAVTIRTDYLSKSQGEETSRDNLIQAFDPDAMAEPDYKEVKVAFKVTLPNTSDEIVINTAEISEDADEKGNPVEDVDSEPNNDNEEEDDIDIEKIKVQYFDLALRKFITGVNDEEITSRVPIFTNNNGEYTYEHTKEPVEVSNGDIVIYTIRVYNEGTIAGYAEEVKDDLPDGLEFLPENDVNIEYGWKMYDADGIETDDVSEAVSIRTDYLSKAQEEETSRDNLIQAFDPDTVSQPDYKEVKIAFKVVESNTSDRILINIAEISEDADEDGEPVDDIDSEPDNDDEEEDDIDIEKVKVTYFDLALRKIVSTTTIIYNGETTVTETGHQFEDDPEDVVKVELTSDMVKNAIIKFTYQIRITNEGEKAGYAYEIKDYIPDGLEFVAADNNEHWTLSEDGKTVTSDELAETLLQPGESAIIEITFRWINGSDNMALKTNWAEISDDSDDDIDSTPDNFEEGEDDIDYAEVILSVKTGVGEHYMGVIAGTIAILGVGVISIKRYVL